MELLRERNLVAFNVSVTADKSEKSNVLEVRTFGTMLVFFFLLITHVDLNLKLDYFACAAIISSLRLGK